MAFNNVNNPRQMFPTQHQGNFSGMQATQPMGIFQQNQPYGVQKNQGFQQSFPGHHMGPLGGPQMGQTLGPQINPQMRPQMGPPLNLPMGPQIPSQVGTLMTPPMGLQIGAFPANVQLGHQFPKQQQKIIDQQRKQAEEQLKKQQEMMKKKQFEEEKRKLQQSFSAKKPSNADALNNLFGKNKTGASDSSMTDLIGSLGSKTSVKPSVSKPTSIFSRPGGSVASQSNLTPGQWGSGYMPSGHANSQGTPSITGWQLHDTDDFGDFSQGPAPGQDTFNDFQTALEPSNQFGVTSGSFPVTGSNVSSGHPQGIGGASVLPQTQAWHSTPSVTAPTSSSTPYSFSLAQNISANSSIHAEQTTQHHLANAAAPPNTGLPHPRHGTQGSQITQFSGDPTGTHTSGIMGLPSHGGQMTQFIDETTKNRAGSMSELMSNAGGNAVTGGAMAQPGTPHIPGLKSQTLLAPTPGFQGAGFVSSPSQPVRVPEKEPNIQQVTEGGNLLEPATETVPEVDDSPERKLELLYGVTLPDWCVNGTDLPGVYKEITDKTIEGSDVIDTNRLFPILMASDLPRDQLGQIWNRANKNVPGQLNALELRIVLGLVALAQAGMKTERLTLEKLASCKAAPIPTIPESVLQTRGRGWSFTESSQATGNMEGSSSGGGHGSPSSDLSVDPNDRYSVFRTIDNPESTSLAISSSIDSRDDFGAFKSVDSPSMVKMGPQTSEFSAFQGGAGQISSGWNRRETSTAGSSLPIQQKDFGNFESVPSQKTDKSAFGDFQGQSSFNNRLNIPGPSNLEPNLGQDDFGDFQSEASSQENLPLANQKSSEAKMPDFSIFQKRLDSPGGTSNTLNVSNIAKTKPPEDDFADFQSGKESEAGSLTLASVQTPNEQQAQSLPGSGDLQFGSKPDNNKSSDVVGGGLFSESVSNTANKSFFNVDTKGPADVDDFGEFQHSPDPFSSNKTFTGFSSKAPEKLVSSLEKFKLSSHTLSPATAGGLDSANRLGKQPADTKQQDTLTGFASFGSDQNTSFADKTKVDEDKYSAFRNADFGSSRGVFSVEKPPPIPTQPPTTTSSTNDQLADDGFADFGSFEVADQFTSGKDSDFGAFKSPENSQNVTFGMTSDSHSVDQQGFGVFQSSTSTNISSTTSESINSTDFGAFSSFAAGSSNVSSKQPNATATVRDSLINSVSLEPTERYKVLSHDSGDIDQHANAWSRCLNSCLLTLATATLAIQKITEQSVKEEVMDSKEGTSYFSAIVEIYRVTLRIKASINKSAPNNIKLQDIYREIERTWKDISGFLSGSDVLPSKSSLDFTLHHVSASEDGSVACGICLLNVNKTTPESSKHGDSKLMYGGRHYHSTCANFWCNRVDSVLPSLLPIDSLI